MLKSDLAAPRLFSFLDDQSVPNGKYAPNGHHKRGRPDQREQERLEQGDLMIEIPLRVDLRHYHEAGDAR